jgi:hypothetical protein
LATNRYIDSGTGPFKDERLFLKAKIKGRKSFSDVIEVEKGDIVRFSILIHNNSKYSLVSKGTKVIIDGFARNANGDFISDEGKNITFKARIISSNSIPRQIEDKVIIKTATNYVKLKILSR